MDVSLSGIAAMAQGDDEDGGTCPVCGFFGCPGGPDECLTITIECFGVSVSLTCYQQPILPPGDDGDEDPPLPPPEG